MSKFRGCQSADCGADNKQKTRVLWTVAQHAFMVCEHGCMFACIAWRCVNSRSPDQPGLPVRSPLVPEVNLWGYMALVFFYRPDGLQVTQASVRLSWFAHDIRCKFAIDWKSWRKQSTRHYQCHIWLARDVHGLRMHAEFHPDGFIVSPLKGENPQILVAPPSDAETQLNTGGQLETFRHGTVSESLPNSNAFVSNSLLQTLRFRSVDKKLRFFWSPWRGRSPSPPHSRHWEEVLTILAPFKCFHIWRSITPLGVQKIGGNAPQL